MPQRGLTVALCCWEVTSEALECQPWSGRLCSPGTRAGLQKPRGVAGTPGHSVSPDLPGGWGHTHGSSAHGSSGVPVGCGRHHASVQRRQPVLTPGGQDPEAPHRSLSRPLCHAPPPRAAPDPRPFSVRGNNCDQSHVQRALPVLLGGPGSRLESDRGGRRGGGGGGGGVRPPSSTAGHGKAGSEGRLRRHRVFLPGTFRRERKTGKETLAALHLWCGLTAIIPLPLKLQNKYGNEIHASHIEGGQRSFRRREGAEDTAMGLKSGCKT